MLPRFWALRPNQLPELATTSGKRIFSVFLLCHLVSEPGSKSAFGRRECKRRAGVCPQKPWVKAEPGEASAEPGTAGSCKREHAGERREVGKSLIKQG